MTTENYYLVTTTVTYRVDNTPDHDEATAIVTHNLLPDPTLDGVTLEGVQHLFWTEIAEDENGIHYVNSGEMNSNELADY
jgi:hypothetical protein